jgi:hypothetical protein
MKKKEQWNANTVIKQTHIEHLCNTIYVSNTSCKKSWQLHYKGLNILAVINLHLKNKGPQKEARHIMQLCENIKKVK